ncbi:hypothetical protein H4R26_004459 [Coemansia thaxteri]|uniref:Uncharacterized protein n=1 Tax=Coemansia thaxteri TaxID=2663907 RepID=A0A9W8EGQ7_9FUNG|nr:hypothetical protein H4R26_004459 [Coemansia thaxteri]
MARRSSESVPGFASPSSVALPASPTTAVAAEAGTLSSHFSCSPNGLFQGFDQRGPAHGASARTLTSSDGSQSDLHARLLKLRDQVAYLQSENRRLSILSNGGYSSQQTLDEETDDENCPDSGRVPDGVESPRIDLCRWIRGSGGNGIAKPKQRVLHRRHASTPTGKSAKLPPLCLCRPAAVSELLGKHSDYTFSIGEFMSRHSSLTAFKPYTLESSHDMPATPGIALINDLVTHHLPPLAAEEYAAHISRISYLVRALHSIDLADSEFLSNPRVAMLLDLLLDLERNLTLPRVDFLRRHADTIHAMSVHAKQTRVSRDTDTEYVVGHAQDPCGSFDALATATLPKKSPELCHISHMTRAISRHPDFRNTSAQSAGVNSLAVDNISLASSYAANDEPILGDLLSPRSGYNLGNLPRDPPASEPVYKDTGDNAKDTKAMLAIPTLGAPGYDLSIPMTPESAVAAGFDPKLHPVVGPRSMDVLPTLQISNNRSMPLLWDSQSNPRYSQRLRHHAPPRIRTLGASRSGYESEKV